MKGRLRYKINLSLNINYEVVIECKNPGQSSGISWTTCTESQECQKSN
jgi:hypothetical protein